MSINISNSNSENENSPEWQKGYKPEFNFGCCTSCKECIPPECETTIQHFVRGSQSSNLVEVTINRYCKCQSKSIISNGCGDCK